ASAWPAGMLACTRTVLSLTTIGICMPQAYAARSAAADAATGHGADADAEQDAEHGAEHHPNECRFRRTGPYTLAATETPQ
ncbi:MAG: hypothetical protein OXG04_04010, partial [Acidobacteria bacterium]|nr:hypothetical protein [Acidobacteriota bacterium]